MEDLQAFSTLGLYIEKLGVRDNLVRFWGLVFSLNKDEWKTLI